MSLFDGVEKAEIRKSREYMRPGRYVMRINEMKTGKTRKKLDFFVVNCTVVAVLDPSAAAGHIRGPFKIGDTPGWMIMAHWDSFLSTVKGLIFVLAQAGEMAQDESEVTREVIDLAVSDSQPFRGMFIELDATDVIDDATGKVVFTRVRPVRVWGLEEVRSKLTPAQLTSLNIK
jgi:hypothetical protein